MIYWRQYEREKGEENRRVWYGRKQKKRNLPRGKADIEKEQLLRKEGKRKEFP